MTSASSPERPDHPDDRWPADEAAPAPGDAAPGDPPADETTADAALTDPVFAEVQTQLAERTADLQRLQAEYVNYKRRVDRDRQIVRETATASVLTALLPVLDDIDRARQHGQLDGGFRAVAESLEKILANQGLQRFGEPGEAFDPHVHEALMHSLSVDVDRPTAETILQAGYRVGDRVVRAARVAVVEPESAPPQEATEPDHGEQ